MRARDAAALALCGLGPIGGIPLAPGTWGSAAAALLAPWLFLPLSFPARLAVLGLLFVIAGAAASRVEALLGRKDPGRVVVDELIGQWTAYLFFPSLGALELFLGFVFFRIFDVAKPWPVKASESWLPGGYGIMIDDVLAGLYAFVCLGLFAVVSRGGA